MAHPSSCQGMVKEQAVVQLLHKMNKRIPNRTFETAFRVFGYKYALTKADLSTLYFGPAPYKEDHIEVAIDRLATAESISPIAEGVKESESDLQALPMPKALLTFSDFQESFGAGKPLQEMENARRQHKEAFTAYNFYLTQEKAAQKLAKDMAKAGGGQAWEICPLLEDEDAFENMMLTVFGSADLCTNAPAGAQVDERGCWVVAYNEYFDFNKAEVKKEFRPKLVEAAGLLKEAVNPQEKVVIAGFTDNKGTQEYNMSLGQRRAQAVADILIAEGVEADRLTVVSYGQNNPVAENTTEAGRARNRRVEFHVGSVPQTY